MTDSDSYTSALFSMRVTQDSKIHLSQWGVNRELGEDTPEHLMTVRCRGITFCGKGGEPDEYSIYPEELFKKAVNDEMCQDCLVLYTTQRLSGKPLPNGPIIIGEEDA